MDRLPITRRDMRAARWFLLGPLGVFLGLLLVAGLFGPAPDSAPAPADSLQRDGD